jgi:signal transduction histidine kinase
MIPAGRLPLINRIAEAADRLGNDAVVFAVLRALTVVGGMAALFVAPPRAEHAVHVTPLLGGFVVYKAALLAVLGLWPERARQIFLATLASDLAVVFLLVWFTGGGESHFYLLFYLLVALNAYHFGPGIGVLAAVLASVLLAVANALAPPATSLLHIGSRAAVLGLLAVALGHAAERERRARARAEQLNRDMEAAMARLARAEQLAAVGRVSAKMAHEVRNPLGAINLNVDLLGDIVRTCPAPDVGEANELLGAIREEVRALAELTEEYLVAARLPSPRREKESVNDLVTDLVAFLRPVADRHGATIALELDEALPPVACDRVMVRQALRNLVKNALEMLPRGGQVAIATRATPERAVITVTDNGPGLSPDARKRLFEPFFTTKDRGTGLGLSIAREIARQHGGDVTWTDVPGGGARFSLGLALDGGARA